MITELLVPGRRSRVATLLISSGKQRNTSGAFCEIRGPCPAHSCLVRTYQFFCGFSDGSETPARESDHLFGGNSGDEALLSMTKPRQMIYKANACCFHYKFPLKVKYYYVGDILTHFVRTRALSKEGRVD